MQGTIKVDPQKLISTANEFNATGGKVKGLTADMMSKVTSMSSVWEGDASNTYINRFKELQDDMDRMFSMIQEHVTDLNDMAQQYITAENANIDLGGSLAGDVIQ